VRAANDLALILEDTIAASGESAARFADKAGVTKNMLHRALHPDDKRYGGVVTQHLGAIMDSAGITFCAQKSEMANLAEACEVIRRLPLSQPTRNLLIVLVRAAGLAG
jgi:hypothetical protein